MKQRKRVLMALSGGVDSALAAYLLLEQGYELIGATIRGWTPPGWEELTAEAGGCCSLSSVEDARRIAFKLGIPYYVFNFSDSFEAEVVRPFVDAYFSGQTPNPCILCNQHIRFGMLYHKAKELQADYVATGHYARIQKDEQGVYHLFRGMDPKKDQSYMLYTATQENLAMTLYPLGEMFKEQTRKLAEQKGIEVFNKPDSQDICFIPDGDTSGFLQGYQPGQYEGDIYHVSGVKLGKHQGYHRYTIGQRQGLGVAWSKPLYVLDILPNEKRIIVGEKEYLQNLDLRADQVHWISGNLKTDALRCQVKIRYAAEAIPATLVVEGQNTVRVQFEKPVFAVTPGQTVVFYLGDEVLGGGRILNHNR